MEPRRSLPCSQELANFVHPEQDKFTSCLRPHTISWRSTLIVSSHVSRDLPSDLFRTGFRTKNHVCISPLPKTSHMSCLSHLFWYDRRMSLADEYSLFFLYDVFIKWRQIKVAVRSKAWVCGLYFVGLRVRILSDAWICICCECCVLHGRGVWVWLLNLQNEEALAH